MTAAPLGSDSDAGDLHRTGVMLVELRGGNVPAQSDGEDTGATFTLTLPVPTARTAAREAQP